VFVVFCYCTYKNKKNAKKKKRMQAEMELKTFNRMAETSSYAYAKPAGAKMDGYSGGGDGIRRDFL
jgi:hypothetical protein